jgi:hypothetical protein
MTDKTPTPVCGIDGSAEPASVLPSELQALHDWCLTEAERVQGGSSEVFRRWAESLARFGTRPAAEPLAWISHRACMPPVLDFAATPGALRVTPLYDHPPAAEPDMTVGGVRYVGACPMCHGNRAAEPSQSGSAGEAEGFEAWAQTILGDNPTWRESGDGELARQAWNASLSRQAPAAVDFEKWWLAEVAANAPAGLTTERIQELWVEHGLDECDPEGFARIIEREVLASQTQRPAPAGQAVEALTKIREFVKSRKYAGYDGPCMDAIRNIDTVIATLTSSRGGNA